MENTKQTSREQWILLLTQAINEGVDIQVNHRFKYKNKNLGSFLVSVKQKNKTELLEKIEMLGFDFKKHSKNPEHYVENFINKLSTDINQKKTKFQTSFNKYILPKKDILKKKTILDLNRAWRMRFNEVRHWGKSYSLTNKIIEWKKFRYDIEKNPEEKWFKGQSQMKKLYYWVYTRKMNRKKMNLIIENFNQTEKDELQKEGFL